MKSNDQIRNLVAAISDARLNVLSSQDHLTIGRKIPPTSSGTVVIGGITVRVFCESSGEYFADPMEIHAMRSLWYIENNPPAVFGGSNPDLLRIQIDSAVDIPEIVANYFFGTPTLIDNWIFNIHRHPLWSKCRIESLLKTIPTVGYDEWERIEARCSEEMARRNASNLGFLDINDITYAPITSAIPRHHSLLLRNDGMDAAFVEPPDLGCDELLSNLLNE